jgi:NAD-dependent dihydropyrimidine dehydrogenase PreA subunit
MRTKFVRLNTGKCRACWNCLDVCTNNIISRINLPWHKHTKLKNNGNCTGCLKCLKTCEFGAFELISKHKNMETTQSFNKRAFVSVVMFASGLALPFSGYMNHSLQFDLLSTGRHFWMSVHNASALLFAIFAVLHIIYNRRALVNHIKRIKSISIKKEALLAFALVIFVVGLISLHALHVR